MLAETRLSESAIDLLLACIASRNPKVTEANREHYRELARAGIMYPLSGFAHGPEASFRFTEEGWNRKEEWVNGSCSLPRST